MNEDGTYPYRYRRISDDASSRPDRWTALEVGLRQIHMASSMHPIKLPSPEGVFPNTFLLRPPPIVLDTNRLRDTVLYGCRHERQTILVTAANAGVVRLYAAPHVIDEVAEHGLQWADAAGVPRSIFLRRWFTEYMPLIRVVPTEGLEQLLSPEEAARIASLSVADADDVPSARLALVLQAFFLSNDRAALRAVYGPDIDVDEHETWLEVLRAGGDAGELGQMLQFGLNVAGLMGQSAVSGLKRIEARFGWWALIPFALGFAIVVRRASPQTKERITSSARSLGTALLETAAAVLTTYRAARERFERRIPEQPTWESLAEVCPPEAVLARACLHTLARSPQGDRSARELAGDLPFLPVASGEAKVRAVLRTRDCFFEAWRGRWQVGEVAEILVPYLQRIERFPGQVRVP